jgi:Ice-binding-like/Bacterial Ig-like domain
MRALNKSVLFLIVASLAACGQQLVEFGNSTTGDDAGTTGNVAPTVTSTNPGSGLLGLCIPAQINATFSDAMDPLTIGAAQFTVTTPGPTAVAGAVTYDAGTRVASFAPTAALSGSTTYTATVTTGAKNAAGTALAANKVWSFTTSSSPCVMPVNLRSLSSFVAVAGAGLTNSNTQLPAVTTLKGDVGLSPTATCMSDGSVCNPPAGAPKITGNLYANDPAGKASAAKADLVSAYNDAQGRPPGSLLANLDGLILSAGVYTSGSTMDLAVNGTLTLDAKNDQNAVWIFQVGSALTANAGSKVVLINGAKAANVFWAIGSSSTLGTNVDFKGTVLAQASNSVGTGATVEGRLVCTTGAISLLSNVITLPAP